MKKVLCVFLSLLMTLGIFTGMNISAFAEVNNTLDYDIVNNEVIINCITSESAESFVGELAIPETIEGYPVVEIGENAFQYASYISTISIPKTVRKIGSGAFVSCSSLENIYVDEANENFSSEDGVLFDEEKTEIIRYPESKDETFYIVPDTVMTIGNMAFFQAENLITVRLNDALEYIDDYAFSSCIGLSGELVIPENVYYIGMHAFSSSINITSVKIENAPVDIEDYAFEFCTALLYVDLGSETLYIGDEVFYGCEMLEEISIPDTLRLIGKNAFVDTVLYNDSNNWVDGAFYLGDYLIETDVEKIDYVYRIKPGTKVINVDAFMGAVNLVYLVIPDSVIYINEGTVENCDNFWHILYEGTQEQWEKIPIYVPNGVLIDTQKHFGAGEDIITRTVKSEPTCLTEGIVTYNCSLCEEEHNVSTFAENHDYEIVGNVEAGCVDEGYDIAKCKDCGYEENTNWVTPYDHNIENGVCSNCGMPEEDCIESEHPYQDDYTNTWTIKKDGALRIAITFSNLTKLEEGIDYIYIYDGDDELVQAFSGIELRGKRIVVFSDTVKIKLETDGSVTEYGFAISKVETFYNKCSHRKTELLNKKEPDCTNSGYSGDLTCVSCTKVVRVGSIIEPLGHDYDENNECTLCGKSPDCYESEHDYTDDFDYTWTITREGAEQINITFSDKTYTEPHDDIITIYDGDDNVIGEYSGRMLSGETVTVNSDVVKIRFTTDDSFTAYGFEITKITAVYPCRHENTELRGFVPACVGEGYSGDKYCADCDVLIERGTTLSNVGHYYEDGICVNCNAPEGLTYEIVDDEIKVTGYTGNSASLVIPEEIAGYPVAVIGDMAFLHNDFISVTLPDTIREIGHYAFTNCENLETVNIPSSVEIFGNSAFSGCKSFTSIVIPEGVTQLSYGTFQGCYNLKTVVLPQSLKVINEYAFSLCRSLEEINIPSSLEEIGAFAFHDCDRLETFEIPASVKKIGTAPFAQSKLMTEIKVAADNEYFSTDEYGVLFNKDKTVLIEYPTENKRAEYNIPATVKTIEASAFNWAWNLKKVVIPEGVEKIRYAAFAYCRDLLEADLPSTLKTIGMEAFEGCDNLTSVVIPESMTYIEDAVFSSCNNIRNVVIPASVTTIGSGAFSGCTSLYHVLYKGTEEQWNNITFLFEGDKTDMIDRTVHFNAKGDEIKLVARISPTCVNLGHDVFKCSLCEMEFKDNQTIEIGHSFSDDYCENCGMHFDDCIESEHYYSTGCDESWTIYKEGAEKILITFSNQTFTEEGYDFITIYNALGGEVGTYDADFLKNRTIEVDGDTAVIRLTSDVTGNEYYGFAVAKVQAIYNDVPGLYVPAGKTTIIDNENMIIYGLVPYLSFLTFTREYATEYRCTAICDDIILGTGSKIRVISETGAPIGEYTVVIFGDLNGDGWYDGQDATIVDCLINGMLTETDIGECAYMAADCNHDGDIDAMDYNCLTSAGLMRWEVNQDKTGVGVVPDAEYFELIDQAPETASTPDDTNTETDIFASIINFIMQVIDVIIAYLSKIFA